ncbi:MAG: sulfite exporter TauE/SafE family protein [FCB group bacterium]|nr:sulfite exporter TauE/SafE family protein [FCB group bacterium]
MEFATSGVETYWWLPALAACLISMVTSTAGISGAFLLLPFQVSVLGFTTPGVTPTNLLFNVVAIPGGVFRYYREKRMVWPLVWTIAIGTVPGLAAGVFIRLYYLPDPGLFKMFVGLVLIFIASRLISDIIKREEKIRSANGGNNRFEVTPLIFNFRRIAYDFNGEKFEVPTPMIFILSALVGMIGGIYGIGGGAILAPILVTLFRLPIHTVSGATLCSTFLTSTMGVLFYVLPSFTDGGSGAMPDWHLGLMFGVGGAIGIYFGARIQKLLPARLIKAVLGAIMFIISLKYIVGYFS